MRHEKSGLEVEQDDLFRSRLSSILDHRHPLYVLAEAIDWETLEREFGAFYVENGDTGVRLAICDSLSLAIVEESQSQRFRITKSQA